MLGVTPRLSGLRLHLSGASEMGIAAVLVFLVVLLQLHSGAYSSDFTNDEDEAAHVVSSLLVHDYITTAAGENPMHFAKSYYLHYPKVAIGHWPPVFYASEASWMLLFGRTRTGLLSFVGATSAALLVGVFLFVRRLYSTPTALLAALALVTPEFLQTAMESVSPNCLLALLVFAATAAYGSYLTTRSSRAAVLFAALAITALFVHGRGAPLLLVPAMAAILRRPALLRTWVVLPLAILLAVVLSVPVILRQADPLSAGIFLHQVSSFPWRVASTMSLPVGLIAVLGGISLLRRAEQNPEAAAFVSLFLSCWVFHSAVNAGWADYYLISAAPAIAVLFGAGIDACLHCFTESRARRLGAVALTLLVSASWLVGLRLVRKHDLGYHLLLARPSLLDNVSIYLTAGSPLHEGALISEVALRDRGLQHIVLRSSKVLAHSWWTGSHYRALFSDPQSVNTFLAAAHVRAVVIQQTSEHPQRALLAHMALLAEALGDKSQWKPVCVPDQPAETRIFCRVGESQPGRPEIRIDMGERLGSDLQLER